MGSFSCQDRRLSSVWGHSVHCEILTWESMGPAKPKMRTILKTADRRAKRMNTWDSRS